MQTPSSRWHWLTLLAVLPAIMTVTLPDWMYSQTDYIDAWVYNGFFRHFRSYSSFMFPQTYYGSRLGWIVPGYISYRLFNPHVAAIVLHYTFYSLAVSSVYVIVRRVTDASNALFAAFVFGLYLCAIRALGGDYVDGAVITYALLTVAVGVHGLAESKLWATFVSGAAAAAMVNSNMGAVFLFAPILVWFIPDSRAGWRSPSLRRHAAMWVGGIVAGTISLSVISVMVGGRWDFFLESYRWMRESRVVLSKNPWDVAGVAWIGTSPWLFLPVSTLAATLVVWLRSRGELNAGQRKAIGALGVLTLSFVLWDFVGTGAMLYWPFYASWLMPWTFIAIGAVLTPRAIESGADWIVLAVSAVILSASLAWLKFTHIPGFGLIGFGVTFGLCLVPALFRSSLWARLGIVVAIACVNGWLPLTSFYLPGGDRSDAFRAIDEGMRVIDRHLTVAQPRFLLASPTKLAHYIRGLTSVYLWGYTIVSERYPSVTAEQASLVTAGAIVVVIAEQPDAANTFDEVFAPFKLRGIPRGSESIVTDHGRLYLTFLEAKAL